MSAFGFCLCPGDKLDTRAAEPEWNLAAPPGSVSTAAYRGGPRVIETGQRKVTPQGAGQEQPRGDRGAREKTAVSALKSGTVQQGCNSYRRAKYPARGREQKRMIAGLVTGTFGDSCSPG